MISFNFDAVNKEAFYSLDFILCFKFEVPKYICSNGEANCDANYASRARPHEDSSQLIKEMKILSPEKTSQLESNRMPKNIL